jgi:FkbH-like protein
VSERFAAAIEHLSRAEAFIRSRDHRAAAGALRAAVGTDDSQAVAQRASALAASLDPRGAGLERVSVAFLSDHHLGPLPRLVRAQALLSDLDAQPYVPDFDVWLNEIGDPDSALYASAPDVVILDVLLERLAPALAGSFLALSSAEVDRQIGAANSAVFGALDALRQRSNARVILHSFARPTYPALGIYDRRVGAGQIDSIDRLNALVRSEAARRTDVYVLDVEQLVIEIGSSAFFDRRMYAIAKVPYGSEALSRLALEHVKYLRAFLGRAKKVLVLDADNTIWGGIVGEDGLDGIRLDSDSAAAGYLELQRHVAELGRKGVVLALNSSNERADVLEVFAKRPEMLLRAADFAVIVANWEDKAENLLGIARTLDLSLDSFVFVDDDPVQCARVRGALPEVVVVELEGDPFSFAPRLARAGWFDTLALTDEDRRRNELYRADVKRHELEQVAESSEEFVSSLGVHLFISRLARGGLARAASLTQRTNQFNLTTRRYTEPQLRDVLVDPASSAFTVRLVDRFGDIGVIGLVLLRREGPRALIDVFLMSCRALRRRVEDSMLAFAVSQALRSGATEVIGTYAPTAKNAQTATFYPDHGFEPLPLAAGSERSWKRTTELEIPTAVVITYEGEGWS